MIFWREGSNKYAETLNNITTASKKTINGGLDEFATLANFRKGLNLPAAGTVNDVSTAAMIKIGDDIVYGFNSSTSRKYLSDAFSPDVRRSLAQQIRQSNSKLNVDGISSTALWHAEFEALLLAHNKGLFKDVRSATIYADRYTCRFCKNSMSNLITHLNLDELIIVAPQEINGALASTKYISSLLKK